MWTMIYLNVRYTEATRITRMNAYEILREAEEFVEEYNLNRFREVYREFRLTNKVKMSVYLALDDMDLLEMFFELVYEDVEFIEYRERMTESYA